MGLASYTQIQFPPIDASTGSLRLVINRPGYPDLIQPDADTLRVSNGTVESYANPFLESDYVLSKKFTTTVGRRAIDDLSIQMRDGYAYTGQVKVSGTWTTVSENFLSIYQTFFDVWFGNSAVANPPPYKAFLLYTDYSPGSTEEVSHIGWIDPSYNPSSDAYVLNPGTANQIWLGTRTIKMTAMSQAQLSLTWRNILLPYSSTAGTGYNPYVPSDYAGITSSDCQEGTPYNGFMLVPNGSANKSNTRPDMFSAFNSGGGNNWMQAVPHYHLGDGTANPVLVGAPAAVWPGSPWQSDQVSGVIAAEYQTNLPYHPTAYAVGDQGTVTYSTTDPGYALGGVLAVYEITQIIPGVSSDEVNFNIISAGTNYAVDSSSTAHATVATSGSGSGLLVQITRVMSGAGFGPSGLVFISIGTIFAKIAKAMGLKTFTPSTDMASALNFMAQSVLDSGGQKCFPASFALSLDDLWISLNVFAKSHPFDGSFWGNPVGFSPDTAVLDVITGLCDFLLSDFNEVPDNTGASALVLTAMGATSGGIPTSWIYQGSPAMEEASTAPTNVQVNYKGDNLIIQCPISDNGQSSNVEIPIRLHRIGATSGNILTPDTEACTWDGTDVTVQADNCFKIVWFDNSKGGAASLNPDCWKSLCYAYWFDSSGGSWIYPSTWQPFPNNDGTYPVSHANSFFVVNAIWKRGTLPDEDMQNLPNGNDYFNACDYHSVAFASLNILRDVIQTFEFAGIADGSGSVRAITSGMAGTWRFADNATQNWRGIQVDQTLINGNTTIKFQAIGSSDGFPQLTDLPYGPISGGGTSSSTGGNTTTGGNPNGNIPTSVWSTASASLTASTNDLAITLTTPNVYLQLSATAAYNLTGIVPTSNCIMLVITNTGANAITLVNQSASSLAANRFLFLGVSGIKILGENSTITFFYDGTIWRELTPAV